MNSIFKSLSLALINAMMIMTFILSPIPFSGNSNIAYAADETSQASDGDADDLVSAEEGCDEGSTDDKGNKRYKAGCEFNEDLATSDAKTHYPDGIKGIIEQFVGAAFALVGITLFLNPLPDVLMMCPQNSAASINYPIVQAGSLTYLLGEISANAEFRKGSEIAVDKTFAVKKDETYDRKNKDKEARQESQKKSIKNKESNNKQIAAYDALEKIYGHQVSGLEKKVLGAGLAELAFVTATGIEVTNILSMCSTCTANLAKMETEGTSILETYADSGTTAIGTSLEAWTAANVACEGCKADQVAACGAIIAPAKAYIAAVKAADVAVIATGTEQQAQAGVVAEKDSASLIASYAGIAVGFVTGFFKPSEPKSVIEIAEDNGIAIANDAAALELKTARLSIISTIGSNICTPANAVLVGLAEAVETVRMDPVFCCGSLTKKGQDHDGARPTVCHNDEKSDNSPVAVGVTTGLYKNNHKYYVKAIIENTLYRIAIHQMIKKYPDDPKKEIQQYAKVQKYIDYIMENQDSLIAESNIKKEYEKLLKKNGEGSEEVGSYLMAAIQKLKSEIFVSSAHAVDFKQLLNIGVKVILLNMVMGTWLRENALPKPKTRAWTWGIMSVVNGAILSFDMKSLGDAKDRVERVREEKEKFLESHALKTKVINQNDATGGEGAKVTLADSSQQNGGGSGIMECAVPKGDGFAPSVCPSVVPRKRFQLANMKSGQITGGIDTKALGLLSDATFSASTSGMSSDSPSLSSAKLAEVQATSNALKKRNANLIKKYDSLEEDRSKKLGKKPSLLSSSLKKFGKIFSGNAKTSGVTGSQLSKGSNLIIPKIEKINKQNKKTAYKPTTIPTFNMPTAQKNDFDFDLGGEGGTTIDDEGKAANTGKAEEDLSQFVVNSGEINEDENVNIFKLISNRYLRSYPTLLNEKKKRVKGTK